MSGTYKTVYISNVLKLGKSMLQPDDARSASKPTPISASELQQLNYLGCAIMVAWGTGFTGAPNPPDGTRRMNHEGGLGGPVITGSPNPPAWHLTVI